MGSGPPPPPLSPPPPPSGPSVEKQDNNWLNYKLGRRSKVFSCHKMNKSASTGGFSLLMKLFIEVYENK